MTQIYKEHCCHYYHNYYYTWHRLCHMLQCSLSTLLSVSQSKVCVMRLITHRDLSYCTQTCPAHCLLRSIGSSHQSEGKTVNDVLNLKRFNEFLFIHTFNKFGSNTVSNTCSPQTTLKKSWFPTFSHPTHSMTCIRAAGHSPSSSPWRWKLYLSNRLETFNPLRVLTTKAD